MTNYLSEALNLLSTVSAVSDRPSYVEDPEKVLLENREEYNRIVSKNLLPTLTHAAAEIYERPGNRFEQAVEDFYADPGNQALIAPVIAAFEDAMPGLPFIDLIPDPPEELPGTSATGQASDRMRRLIGAVDMSVAIWNLPVLAKRSIGRIVTNLKRPKNYNPLEVLEDAGYLRQFTDFGQIERTGQSKLETLASMIKAVAADKPLYTSDMIKHHMGSQLLMREPLYRKQFGLKPRSLQELAPKGSLKGTKWEDFSDANVYITNPDGTLRFNPESEIGQAALQEVARPGKVGLTYGTAQHKALGEYLRSPLVEGVKYDPEIHRVNPYRNTYGKAELMPVKGLTTEKYSGMFKPSDEIFSINDEIDRVFYNDIWDFKLNTSETKHVEGYLNEIKSILTDKMPETRGEAFRGLRNREIDIRDPQFSIIDRLKILKSFFTDPDMKDYHGTKMSNMMRSFMNKIIDHVEIKGTVTYRQYVDKDRLGKKLINVEDEMFRDLR